MDTKKYYGWANYATWRVNLEFFDGQEWQDTFGHYKTEDSLYSETPAYHISLELREMVEEFVDSECTNTWLRGWLYSFLDDVNFYEIAKHIYEELESDEIDEVCG